MTIRLEHSDAQALAEALPIVSPGAIHPDDWREAHPCDLPVAAYNTLRRQIVGGEAEAKAEELERGRLGDWVAGEYDYPKWVSEREAKRFLSAHSLDTYGPSASEILDRARGVRGVRLGLVLLELGC